MEREMRPITGRDSRFSNRHGLLALPSEIFPTLKVKTCLKGNPKKYLQRTLRHSQIYHVRTRKFISWKTDRLLLSFSISATEKSHPTGPSTSSLSDANFKNRGFFYYGTHSAAGIRGTRPYSSATPSLRADPRPLARPRFPGGIGHVPAYVKADLSAGYALLGESPRSPARLATRKLFKKVPASAPLTPRWPREGPPLH